MKFFFTNLFVVFKSLSMETFSLPNVTTTAGFGKRKREEAEKSCAIRCLVNVRYLKIQVQISKALKRNL
jgi:hypothetical protein